LTAHGSPRHPYEYIDSARALDACVSRMRRHGIVGVDTEFIRTRTFFPIPALYQLAGAGEVALIDPTRIDAWQPLADLLQDPGVTIIMHSCSEDLEVFSRHLGINPTAIFDTQIANAFLSDTFSVGYSNLVSRYLDVALGKEHTRSDWLARPLSAEQLRYAVDDVAFLEPLFEVLREELVRRGRMDWFRVECAAVTAPKSATPGDYFRSIRKAGHLNPRHLARLRLLTIWRERHVREQDLPRARFVADDVLVDIAQRDDLSRDDLLRVLRRASGERRAGRKAQSLTDEILELIAEAERLAESALPEAVEPPLTKAEMATVRALKDHAAAQATALGMAPELLARKRDLESCLRHYVLHGHVSATYMGWRYPLLGTAFENILAAHVARQTARPAP
jgi:ribonuclease D